MWHDVADQWAARRTAFVNGPLPVEDPEPGPLTGQLSSELPHGSQLRFVDAVETITSEERILWEGLLWHDSFYGNHFSSR